MSYKKIKCPFCRAEITNGGAARTSHMRKHVRAGDLDEDYKDGGLQWSKNGKVYAFPKVVKREPEPLGRILSEQTNSNWKYCTTDATCMRIGGKVYAFCTKCGEKVKGAESNADDRFYSFHCTCSKTILIAKRSIPEA
jgi:hypothetical protein